MLRDARNIAVILLAALVVTGARAARVSETVLVKLPLKQLVIGASFSHSKNASKESCTQWRHTWRVKQLYSSSVYPWAVISAGCDSQFFLVVGLRPPLLGSSFYFSSLCNKAPPA